MTISRVQRKPRPTGCGSADDERSGGLGEPLVVPPSAATFDDGFTFHVLKLDGQQQLRREMHTSAELQRIDLSGCAFVCAPVLHDVRYRRPSGKWVNIIDCWSRLRDIRVATLLALHLHPGLPLTRPTIARLIDEPMYAVSDDAATQTIRRLRSLLGDGGRTSRFIRTHTGFEVAYSWDPLQPFMWITTEPMILPLGKRHRESK